MADRSTALEVRNPLLALPAARELMTLPAAHRAAFAALLYDLAADANKRAESAWQKRKGPMAAYWRSVSTYAKHTAHALKRGQDQLSLLEAAE